MKNMPATDWEGEGAKIFRPEDLVRNDLQNKLEMLLPGVPKERVTGLVDMVQNARMPDFSWVPEDARGPVISESRKAAEAFDRIAVSKVEAEMQKEERAQVIPEMRKQEEAEKQVILAQFSHELEELPASEPEVPVSQRQIPTMIVKRSDIKPKSIGQRLRGLLG